MTLGLVRAREEAMVSPSGSFLRVTVGADDVFVSWRTSAEAAASEFASRAPYSTERNVRRKRLGFYAVPPLASLRLHQMQQLERAGLRVVHVPATLAGAEIEQVTDYLSARLSRLSKSTGDAGAARPVDPIASAHGLVAADEPDMLAEEGDDAQLDAINDPENAIDDLT